MMIATIRWQFILRIGDYLSSSELKIKALLRHLSKATYYKWRAALEKNPDYVPQKGKCHHQNKILLDDLELKILERIDQDFLEANLLFTDAHSQHIALEEYETALERGVQFQNLSVLFVTGFRGFGNSS
jgi:hypothetical protein